MKIPSQVTWKQMRNLLGSVSIKELDAGSTARQVAEQANSGSGDAYLRGKGEFKAAQKLLEQHNGLDDTEGKLQLKNQDGTLTEAGKVIEAWMGALANRNDMFDGVGIDGGKKLLYIDIDNIDLSDLRKTNRHGEPRKCYAGPDTTLSVFEVGAHNRHAKKAELSEGKWIYAEGIDSVALKRRGNKSVNDAKPQLTIDIDGDKKAGLPGKIKLVNAIRDPSYQRLHLAWGLLEKARVPTQPHTFAEVNINDKHYGTYVAMPPMDRTHFEERFPPKKDQEPAAIFKANWKDMGPATLRYLEGDTSGSQYHRSDNVDHRTYEPREDTPDSDYKHLASFIKTLNAVDLKDGDGNRIEGFHRFNTVEYREAMEENMDVYAFLRTAAMNSLMGSWDTYYKTPSNFYLHIEKREDENGEVKPYTTFCPYDMDTTFGISWGGERKWHEKDIFYQDSEVGDVRLIEVLLRNDQFRSYYVDFMKHMVDTHFTVEGVKDEMGGLWKDVLEQSVYLESDSSHGGTHTARPWSNNQVYESAKKNWEQWGFGGSFKAEGIEHFVRMRRDNVNEQLRHQQLGNSGVDFGGDDWTPQWPD